MQVFSEGTSMLIEGKKYAPEHLGRVLVLGLGKSGHAVLDYLLPEGVERESYMDENGVTLLIVYGE